MMEDLTPAAVLLAMLFVLFQFISWVFFPDKAKNQPEIQQQQAAPPPAPAAPAQERPAPPAPMSEAQRYAKMAQRAKLEEELGRY